MYTIKAQRNKDELREFTTKYNDINQARNAFDSVVNIAKCLCTQFDNSYYIELCCNNIKILSVDIEY